MTSSQGRPSSGAPRRGIWLAASAGTLYGLTIFLGWWSMEVAIVSAFGALIGVLLSIAACFDRDTRPYAGLLVVLSVVIGTAAVYALQRPARVTAPVAVSSTASGERHGNFGPHQYWFRMAGPSTLASLFQPVLPRNDAVILRAVTTLVRDGFAEDVSEANPRIEGRTLVFDGARYRFVVLLIKEDTGEISGMQITRHAKP